ncbi:MAG: protease modulator HflC [Gammaproteobacteria bacterium]
MPKYIIALVIAAFLFALSAFTVKEPEWAILFKLGEIKRADFEPGLHFKLPFINNIRKFDKRILTEDEQAQRYLTQDQNYVIVNSFIKWRIKDPIAYYNATSGDQNQAGLLIYQKVNDNMRGEFGKRSLHDLIAGERAEVMQIVTDLSNAQAQELGAEVVDVRLKRIDFPDDISESVYGRMRAERESIARKLRSQGEEAAERIRAKSDRESTTLLAAGYREAEITRGGADAVATETYAKAYGQDEDFYAFTRRLEAYKNSFLNQSDVMLLEPDSDFFKFFKDPKTKAPAYP